MLPPGSRATDQEPFPQGRGGRGRASAARVNCRLHIDLLRVNVWAVGKQDQDALRRFGSAPHHNNVFAGNLPLVAWLAKTWTIHGHAGTQMRTGQPDAAEHLHRQGLSLISIACS